MKLAVIQFTCPADAAIAELGHFSTQRIARKHGLQIDYRNLEKEGGRGHHLNGIEAVAEEIATYQALLQEGHEWVLKLDADTLWLAASFLDRLAGPWKLIGGGDTVTPPSGLPYPYVRGHAYMIKLEAFRHVPTTRKELEELFLLVDNFCGGYPSRLDKPEWAWPEDEAISGMIRYLFGDEAMLRMPVRDPNCVWIGFWPYQLHGTQCPPEQAREMAARMDFLEFGRHSKAHGNMPRAERQKLTHAAMAQFLKALD